MRACARFQRAPLKAAVATRLSLSQSASPYPISSYPAPCMYLTPTPISPYPETLPQCPMPPFILSSSLPIFGWAAGCGKPSCGGPLLQLPHGNAVLRQQRNSPTSAIAKVRMAAPHDPLVATTATAVVRVRHERTVVMALASVPASGAVTRLLLGTAAALCLPVAQRLHGDRVQPGQHTRRFWCYRLCLRWCCC